MRGLLSALGRLRHRRHCSLRIHAYVPAPYGNPHSARTIQPTCGRLCASEAKHFTTRTGHRFPRDDLHVSGKAYFRSILKYSISPVLPRGSRIHTRHDLGRASWVESALWRSCESYNNGKLTSTVDYLQQIDISRSVRGVKHFSLALTHQQRKTDTHTSHTY